MRSVVSSAKLIALCTLLSRITGLVRDILLAQAFGLGWIQDAFVYAFAVPNLFRRLLGEGAMAPVFVPTFTKTLEHEGPEPAWRLLGRTFALMTAALVVIILLLLLVIAAVWLFVPVAPAQAAPRQLLLGLTALMLPFMLFICIVALFSSILNCVGSFVPAALAPILLNVCMIAGIAWIAPALFRGRPQAQVYIVGATVVLAGVLQVVLLQAVLWRRGVPLGWEWNTRDAAVKRMLKLLVPVALGQGVLAFGVFLDAQVCTMLSHVHGTPDTFAILGWTARYPLEEGALSAVTYAQRLYQFPLGVLVLSLATAALPAFSRMAARAEWPAWAAEVRQSLRLAVFEGVLAGVMMIMLAAPLVRLLFERGRFTPDDTQRAAFVVVWYGVGLWAFCAQHIVLRGFYSLGDVRTPLTISVVLLPLNVLLNITLVWLPSIRESAFAIATATTSALAVVIGLLILQRRSHTAVLDGRTLGALARMLLAGAAAAAVLHYAIPVLTPLAAQLPQRLAARATETFGLLALGTAAYLLAAWLLRLDELRLLLARGRRGSRPGAAPHAP